MKKLFIILFISIPQIIFAQTLTEKIKYIQDQYQQAQDIASKKGSDEWMENMCYTLDLSSKINFSGPGPVLHDVEVFLTRMPESYEFDSGVFNTFAPVLVKMTRRAAFNIYHEMLFDDKTGELLFYYQHLPDFQGDGTIEMRYYYDKGKLIKSEPAYTEHLYLLPPKIAAEKAKALKAVVKNYNTLAD